MMSVVIAQSGHVLADHLDALHVAVAVVGAAHRLQDAARARLQRQVDVLAQARQLGVRGDQLLAHVLRVRARVADALDARRPRPPARAGRRSRSARPSAGRARRSSRSARAASPPSRRRPPAPRPRATRSAGAPAALAPARATARCSTSTRSCSPTEIWTQPWNGRSRFIGRSPGKPSNSK